MTSAVRCEAISSAFNVVKAATVFVTIMYSSMYQYLKQCFLTCSRCVSEVASSCDIPTRAGVGTGTGTGTDSFRPRRDVSSAVVDNVIQNAQPVNNFLDMMTEILGDENM